MQPRLHMLQFTVSGLADIRTLCPRWRALLNRLSEETGSTELEAHRQVGVEVEWRRPGEEVFLNFLAPPALLEQFLEDLQDQGLVCRREEVIPGLVTRCRLMPRNLQ